MKCVCPMGGDRTCPDDCPIAVWASLSPSDRKAQRKPIAERLYGQGFTMEQIATQLGVSKMQISRDLVNCNIALQLKPAKTETNPKGAGRPKGSNKLQPERRMNTSASAEVAAKSILDGGKTYAEAITESGFSSTVLRSAVAREEGRRAAEPLITPDMLSLTAQQKFEKCVQQEVARLNATFNATFNDMVNARVQEFLRERILPKHQEEQDQARRVMEGRRGIMTKATFDAIRRALHPDSRKSISDQRLGEAFDAFMSLEKLLLNEADSPTEFQKLQMDEFEKMLRTPRRKSGRSSGVVRRHNGASP